MSLPRSLTLFGAVMLVVGNVVGAGIFTTSGILAGKVSHPIVFIGVWVFGGILALTGALTYAELGAMFPRAGGDYQFIKEAYGTTTALLLGWLEFWIIFPGSIAALSIAIVEYMPWLPVVHSSKTPYVFGTILLITLINYCSTKLASFAQSTITIGSVVLLVALVIGGFAFGNGNIDNLITGEPGAPFRFSGSAMIAVFFTYSGWFAAAYVGSEVIQPERNVPISLILGTLIVSLLYTGINAVYLLALPLSEMREAHDINIAALAATRLFGPEITGAVEIAIVLAIASCINASVMTGSRLCFAMADDGIFPKLIGRVHPKFQTPYVAIVVQGALALLYVFIGAFDTLLASVVFAMLLSNTAVGIAHIKLRRERPNLPRPYKTHGYPYLTLLFILAHAAFAVAIALENFLISLMGIGIALTAVPFHLIRRRWRDR
jgi:basic amino acid/polyamine antiporter, APA family